MKSGRFARVPLRAAGADVLDVRARVLIAICGHISRGGWAYPSLTTIAKLTGIERSNAARAIKELEDAGLLHRERGGGRGNPTRYHVFDGPETVSPATPIFPETVSPAIPFSVGNGVKNTPETVSPAIMRTERTESDSKRARESWFVKFRGVYPSRGDCGDPEKPARLEFEAALDRGIDPEAIVTGAARYAAEVARAGTPPRFVKMSVNWLKDEGWNDTPPRPVERRRPVAGMA